MRIKLELSYYTQKNGQTTFRIYKKKHPVSKKTVYQTECIKEYAYSYSGGLYFETELKAIKYLEQMYKTALKNGYRDAELKYVCID